MFTLRQLRRAVLLASLVTLSALLTLGGASPATAAERTWTASQTIPVPPASTFAGSAGGDGWGVTLSSDAAYNMFHHGTQVTINCHLQIDSSECWDAPKTITDADGHNFATSGQSGLGIDQDSGKLYAYATDTTTTTGGVVCVDTTQPASDPNPFCGFTALTAPGEASMVHGWMSSLSAPMQVGDRLYSFNFNPGHEVSGTRNTLLCVDMSTGEACAGQPYAIDIGAGTMGFEGPSPSSSAIGDKLMIPVTTDGVGRLACFDTVTETDCDGAWPAPTSLSGYYWGGPFPMLDATGATTGVCLPTGDDPCFTLSGASAATPDGMTSVIHGTSGWNGPAVAIGPRVYVVNGNSNSIECYDYSTESSCTNFPKQLQGLYLPYTVNPDPQRSDCLWVNADNGSAQMQNFDAYSGEPCGQGPLRVLASASVIGEPQCTPSSYVSLQVNSPARDTYDSGSVSFLNGTGSPIPGASDRAIDGTGTVDLTGLDLNTSTGLPQFLISLTGETGASTSITVTLTWTGEDSEDCTPVVGPPHADITASNDHFDLNEAAPTSFTCVDGLGGPGIATCVDSNGATGSPDTGSGSTGTGVLDTSEYGGHSYTVRATSSNGQSRTATFHYSVSHRQTISFPSTAVEYGQPPFSPATASSGLTVTYSDASGQCAVDAQGLVEILGVGSCTVTADQAGNDDYFPAPPVTQTFTIDKGSQTIDFPARTVTVTRPAYSPASASSGLTISYSDASGQCIVDAQGLVQVTDVGSCTVTADQAGDDNYEAAQPVTQTFAIVAGPNVELSGASCVAINRQGYVAPFTAAVVGTEEDFYVFGEPASGVYPWDHPYIYGYGSGDGEIDVDNRMYSASPRPATIWVAVWSTDYERLLTETEVPVCELSTDPTTVSVVGGCITISNGVVQPYTASVTNADDNVWVFTEGSPQHLPDDLSDMYIYGGGYVGASGTVYVGSQFSSPDTMLSTLWVSVRPQSDYENVVYAEVEVPVCGFAPQLSRSPDALDFGSQDVDDGATVGQVSTLTNSGTQTVTLSAISITGDADFEHLHGSAGDCEDTTSLAAGETCVLRVRFDPTATGLHDATLTVTSNAADVTVDLTGTGTQTELSRSPDALAFGSQDVDDGATAEQSSTLTNSGTEPVTLTAIALTDDTQFEHLSGEAGDCTSTTTLTAGQTCALRARFDPTATGAQSAALTVSSDAPDVSVALTGTGIETELSRAPDALEFGSQDVDDGATGEQTSTLTNSGTEPVTLTGISLDDDAHFQRVTGDAGDCTATTTLTAGQSCALRVHFDPASTGVKAATLTVASNTADVTVALSGTGIQTELSRSPDTLAFGSQDIDDGATAEQSSMLTNSGTEPVTLTGIAISGDDTHFEHLSGEAGDCDDATTLAAGESCALRARFDPASTGAKAATLTVSSSEPDVTVALTGTGIQTALSRDPATLAFGSQDVDTGPTAEQQSTLTNSGTETVTLTGVSITGADAGHFARLSDQPSDCTSSTVLPADASCTLRVRFDPSTTGTKAATLTVTSDVPDVTVSLTGTGTQAAVITCNNLTDSGTATYNSLTGTFTGTAGNDVIIGTDGADRINGGGGNDTICARLGDDIVYGGAGDDYIRVGNGNDQGYGEGGNDQIDGLAGTDTLSGGAGDDWITAGAGNDILRGDMGNDRLYGEADNDTLDGDNSDPNKVNGTDYCNGGSHTDTGVRCETRVEIP